MRALGGARGRAARIALVAAWALVALVHLALARERRELDWPLGYLLMELLATGSLAYRAWLCRSESCRAWAFLALSTGLEVPNLLLLYLGIQGHIGAWAQEAASVLSLGTGIFVLVGVLSFPKGPETKALFRRRVLDALIFAASVLFLLWVMGVHGSLRAATEAMELRVFAAYLNAALLGGGLVFAISYHPSRIQGPLGWLAASVLAWLAGLSWWALSGLAPTQGEGGWLAVVAGIPLFQGLAAWSPRPVATPEGASGGGARLSRMLPYLPVVVALGVLATILPGAPLDVMRGAFGIFLVLVVLLLLRQFQAIQDLQVARRTLEERVQQRTEALQQAQDTLLRTERMNTLALMGAGLAHDLNNLLTALKSSAELAAMSLEEGGRPEPKELAGIVTAADRAATLTRRLMGFVRREAEELGPVDLGGEVRGMEATLRLLLPRSVELRIRVAQEEALVVQSSRLRLEQMLVNLVANAADAMPRGGTLAIEAGPGAPGTGWARVEVADTGIGMAPEVMERIFDPFFTTKPPGKGTGLGLSSLKALVEEAQGRLEVESEPGRGTRFRILLPRMI
jgi:signal transduction histidine kinase